MRQRPNILGLQRTISPFHLLFVAVWSLLLEVLTVFFYTSFVSNDSFTHTQHEE